MAQDFRLPPHAVPATWFISGCTSGFGEQLVRQTLARGDKVIGAGRNATRRSKELIELGATIIDLDLTWDHVLVESTVREAIDHHFDGHIDYLFNVAGYGYLEAFEELSPTRILEQFQVNFHGHLNVTRAVLQFMRAQRSGKIGVLSSVDGFVGTPGFSAYAATKHALEGWIESLSREVSSLNIQTLLVEPGAHRTLWFQNLDRGRMPRYDAYNSLRGELDILPEIANYIAIGNPKIAATRMIEVLTGTGFAEGKPMPPRLPLGKDALLQIRQKCQDTLDLLKEWEPAIVSTSDKPLTPGIAALEGLNLS